MNWKDTAKQIEADEGIRFHAYRDTEGVITIGVGRNLESVGISEDEARYMFQNDLRRAHGECQRRIPIFPYLDDDRQGVLVNMMFNLGPSRLATFKKFLAALDKRDFTAARDEMLNSKWRDQVGARAERLAEIMARGG